MKLKSVHFSALGLGVSAIAAIVAILYYRSQAAASQSATLPGGGSFPYFQTAALPSSVTGTTGGSSGGIIQPTTGSGASANDVAKAAVAASAGVTGQDNYQSSVGNVFSQALAKLPNLLPGANNYIDFNQQSVVNGVVQGSFFHVAERNSTPDESRSYLTPVPITASWNQPSIIAPVQAPPIMGPAIPAYTPPQVLNLNVTLPPGAASAPTADTSSQFHESFGGQG